MLKNVSTVMGFTLMSRILGFARDIFIARYLGATAISDAFFAAFRFPNMFRRIFGEGAFNAAFVPMLARELEEGDRERAERFAANAFSWMVMVLGIGTLVAIPLMRWLIALLTFGFLIPEGWSFSWAWLGEMIVYPHGTEKFEMAVAYGRIMFSYLLCMALAAQLSGVLNTLRVFAAPAFAPVLLNVCFLVGLTLIIPFGGFKGQLVESGLVMSWCVCVAGFIQFAMLWVACGRKGFKVRLAKPRVSPKMRRLGVLMLPGIAAAGVQQLNLFIGTQIASVQNEAISWLYFSERVYQLPLGMVGISFGVVLLPEVSRRLWGGDESGAKTAIGEALGFSMLFTLPAAAACMAIPWPMISVLFQHGPDFTAADSIATAGALALFAIGLPGYVLVKILQPGYFARENTKTPMKMAAVTVGVNIVASLTLFPLIGHLGIALATSIAAWVNVGLLWYGLRGWFHVGRALWIKLGKIVAASAVMAASVWAASLVLAPWIDAGGVKSVIGLCLLIGLGASVYGVAALGMRATSVAEVKAGFRR
jgi:putative peptidoglycan lipid II flippase